MNLYTIIVVKRRLSASQANTNLRNMNTKNILFGFEQWAYREIAWANICGHLALPVAHRSFELCMRNWQEKLLLFDVVELCNRIRKSTDNRLVNALMSTELFIPMGKGERFYFIISASFVHGKSNTFQWWSTITSFLITIFRLVRFPFKMQMQNESIENDTFASEFSEHIFKPLMLRRT